MEDTPTVASPTGRKRKTPSDSLSESDSDKTVQHKAKIATLKKLRSQVALNQKILEKPLEPSFCDKYSVEANPIPWFAQLSLDSLSHVLSVEDPASKTYVLSYERIAEIASTSKFIYIMFFTDVPEESRPTNLWYRLTERWLPQKSPGEPVPMKFTFLRSFIKKYWLSAFDPPEIKALEAYLNRFGIGYCEKCGMFPNLRVGTDQKRDLIPLSAFRLMTDEEEKKAKYDDSELVAPFTKDIRNVPNWLRAMLALRGLFGTKYCCVNCNAMLNQQLFSIATPSIFEACARRGRASAKKDAKDNHIWLELQYELVRPDQSGGASKRGREIIPGQYEYCCRCGLLRYDRTDNAILCEDECPDCHKSECVCERCEFCNGPAGCRCIICDRCNRCQNECTKNCRKKGCRCEDSSSEPSMDLSSSSSSSSGLSNDDDSSDE